MSNICLSIVCILIFTGPVNRTTASGSSQTSQSGFKRHYTRNFIPLSESDFNETTESIPTSHTASNQTFPLESNNTSDSQSNQNSVSTSNNALDSTSNENLDLKSNKITHSPSNPISTSHSNQTSGSNSNQTSGSQTNPSSGSQPNPNSGSRTNTNIGSQTNPSSGSQPNPNSGSRTNTNIASQTNQTSGSQTIQTSGSQPNPKTGSQTYQNTGSQTIQTSGSQPNSNTGSQTNQTSGSQIIQTSGSQPNPNTGSQTNQTSGSQIIQTSGSQPNPNTGSQTNQTSGSQTNQTPGSQTIQISGSQPNQTPGSQPNQTSGSQSHQTSGSRSNKISSSNSNQTSGSDAMQNSHLVSVQTPATGFNQPSTASQSTISSETQLQQPPQNGKREFYKEFFISTPKKMSYSAKLKAHMEQVYFLEYNVSKYCGRHLKNLSEGLLQGEKWALNYLDANGKQANNIINGMNMFLGSFELCELFENGRYYHYHIKKKLLQHEDATLSVIWYVCLPHSCKQEDARIIGKTFEKHFHLDSVESANIERLKPGQDFWFIFTVFILTLLAVVSIASTVIDGVTRYLYQTDHIDLSNNSGEADRKLGFLDRPVVRRIVTSFSLRVTYFDIWNTDDTSPLDIACLHGLRVLSMLWVILGSVYYLLPPINNQQRRYIIIKSWTANIAYSPFAVDSFFLMSGCLASYLFLNYTKNAFNLRPLLMAKFYVHRYLRLTPMYILALLIYVGITPHMESGSFAKVDPNRESYCRSNLWKNLLYISNLFDLDKQCMAWTWYIAAEIQLYTIAPIAIVPIFYGYRKAVVLIFSFLMMCQLTSTLVNTEFRDWSKDDFQRYLSEVYIKPWARVGPYAIGLMLGYILACWEKQDKLRKVAVVVGWLASILGVLVCLCVQDNELTEEMGAVPSLDLKKHDVFRAIKSPLWGFSFAWIIFACHTGYGGFINCFLAWRAWLPISRLSYGIYLCHVMVINWINLNHVYESQFTYAFVVQRTIVVAATGFWVALLLALLVEMPLRNLLKSPRENREPENALGDTLEETVYSLQK